MKKSLIALAVAGAMTAPLVAQADATLYGKFEMRVVAAEDADLEVQSDDFRFGIKGDSAILGNSKALFNLELEVNPETSGANTATADADAGGVSYRKAYVGATGDWGTALIGRIANPAEQIVSFTGNNSEATAVSDQNPDHLGSTIAYVTPNMGGFTGYVGLVAEGQGDDNQDDVDGKLIGGSFATGGLTVAASYWAFEDKYVQDTAGVNEEFSLAQLGAQYTIDMTTIGAIYAKKELDNYGDYTVMGLRVDQKIGDLTLGANYHNAELDIDGAPIDGDIDQYGLFATYALGAQAALDFELVDINYDSDMEIIMANVGGPVTAATGLPATDGQVVSVGYTVKF